MKANLKGLDGIKGLLLKHCEKVGIAVVALGAIWLIYSSLQVKGLPPQNQASELDRLVTQAGSTIDNFVPADVPPDERLEVKSMTNLVARAVTPKHYQTSKKGFNPPPVPPSARRIDPVLLAPVDLEVKSGSGLLASIDESVREQRRLQAELEQQRRAQQLEEERERERRDADRGRRRTNQRDGFGRDRMIDPEHPHRRRMSGRARPAGIPTGGDEKIEKVYWATVVAKVPIEDQIQLYRDALENTRQFDLSTDCPNYLGYFVERAEVRRGAELKWQQVFVGKEDSLLNKTKDWAPSLPEVVDPRAYHSLLTYPLPPLVGRDFGADATHSDIPLAIDVEEEPETEEVEEGPTEQPTEEGEIDFLAGTDPNDRRTGRGTRGRPYNTRGGYPTEGYAMEREYGGGGYYAEEAGRGYEGYMESERYGGRDGRGASTRRSLRRQVGGIFESDVPYLLFRFFDFSVQPGKRYKYRVRLVLYDVNRGVRDAVLDPEVIERLAAPDAKPYRVTEWSEPSPVIGIPLAGSVRLASAEAASDKSYYSQPSVNLLVQSFDLDEKGNAIQAAKEKEFEPGDVANMTEDVEVIIARGLIDKIDSFPFHTDIAVVDISGGERLTRDLTTPARVLLMDPTGRLYIRDEMQDKDEVELHAEIFAEEDDGRGYRGGEGYYDRGGGRGYEGMFEEGFGRGR